MSSFAFGAPPSGNPDGDDGKPPDDKDKRIDDLEGNFSSLKLKFKEVRVQNEDLKRELKQTQDILGNVQAPTIFNQLQVNTMM